MKRCALLLCLVAASARADAVDIQLRPRGVVGKGYPQVIVRIVEPIAGFALTLHRGDGKDQEWKGGGRPGVTRTIDLVQPDGKLHYTGELTVNFPNATHGTIPLEFDAEFLGPLTLELGRKDLDPAARRVTFTLSRPARKA